MYSYSHMRAHTYAVTANMPIDRKFQAIIPRLQKGLAPVVRSKNKRDGSSARETVATSLAWLARTCKVEVSTSAEVVRAFKVPRRSPEGSEPLSIKLVVGLERNAAGHANEFVRGQSAAHVADAFACLRLEQSNFCLLEFEDEGAVHGFVGKDKHPVPAKQKARPFWMPVEGVVCGRMFLDSLYAALDGVETGCFLLRDTGCGVVGLGLG